jgi:hypothetical protein
MLIIANPAPSTTDFSISLGKLSLLKQAIAGAGDQHQHDHCSNCRWVMFAPGAPQRFQRI